MVIQARCRERPLSDRKAAVRWPRSVRRARITGPPLIVYRSRILTHGFLPDLLADLCQDHSGLVVQIWIPWLRLG